MGLARPLEVVDLWTGLTSALQLVHGSTRYQLHQHVLITPGLTGGEGEKVTSGLRH